MILLITTTRIKLLLIPSNPLFRGPFLTVRFTRILEMQLDHISGWPTVFVFLENRETFFGLSRVNSMSLDLIVLTHQITNRFNFSLILLAETLCDI